MKKAEYKVVSGPEGLPQLEKRVTEYLNQGWKLIGGISFNAGYPYQAIARVVTVSQSLANDDTAARSKPALRGAQAAMSVVDELT